MIAAYETFNFGGNRAERLGGTMLFSSTFGMCEMEIAAEIIWRKPPQFYGYYSDNKPCISFDDFKHDGSALNGFCHLMIGGYISAGYPNCIFFANKEFYDKIQAKLATLSLDEIKKADDDWYKRVKKSS